MTRNTRSSYLGFVALFFLLEGALTAPTCQLSSTVTTTATYHSQYDQAFQDKSSVTVSCSLNQEPASTLQVTAVSTTYNPNGILCGSCLNVTGQNGSTVVMVIDTGGNQIDMSEHAFGLVGPVVDGVIPISFYQVPCYGIVTGNVGYVFKAGTTPGGYFNIQVQQTLLPLDAVAVTDVNSKWVNLTRQNYYFWLAPGGANISPTFQIQMTNLATGQTIQDSITQILSSEDQVLPGNVQFTDPTGCTPPPFSPTSGSSTGAAGCHQGYVFDTIRGIVRPRD